MNFQSNLTDARVVRSGARSRTREARDTLPTVPSSRPVPDQQARQGRPDFPAVMPCESLRSHAVDRSLRKPFSRTLMLIAALLLGACMPDSTAGSSDVELTVYG